MNILISNDDGIYAPGIAALYKAVRDFGDITVAAPDTERSAVGHAITISDPIKCRKVSPNGLFSGYSISGTPADCVKLAMFGLMDNRPDLLISGVNLGPNAGISVIYSGTVSAATEGTILGVPSIAVSLCTYQDPKWETAIAVVQRLVREFKRNSLPPETLLNVNIPNVTEEELGGYRVTRMGRSKFTEVFHRRTDPRGNVYYWMDGEMQLMEGQQDTDVQALEDHCVSLTPIGFDLTHTAVFEEIRGTWSIQSD